MSPVLQKQVTVKGKPAAAGRPTLAGLPQVNLLPPEIRATRALATVKRWLVIALIVVVALVGAVYAFALVDRGVAANELTEADAETIRLRDEERKYAEVPQVLTAIAATTDARTVGMAKDVQWKSYIDAIAAVLPADVTLDSFQIAGPSPLAAPPTAQDPLTTTAPVGTITFAARSATLPKTAEWIDALRTVPGFSSPWASTMAITAAEGSGTTYFSVQMSVDVTDAAFSHRYDPTAQEGN